MNPNLARVAPSLIRAINARKQPDDIDFGLGEPRLRPPIAPFEAATEWVRRHGCAYTTNAGDAELREHVARYVGVADAARVCITVGSEEALYLAIKAVIDPVADEVLIVEPCYLAYEKICALEGIASRTVALDAEHGFRPDAERVLEALGPRTRLLVLNTPANPTGRVWPVAELQRLADGLAARPGAPVAVLADEVYRELYYDGSPPASMAALYPHVLVAGSLSKSNALTGLRLGWLAGPAEMVAAAVKVHQFVNTAASTFSQRVALELFRTEGMLAAHRPHYAAMRAVLLRALVRDGVDHVVPEGAFYCMLRVLQARHADSTLTALALLDAERVVAVPGAAFGTSAEGWLRISWVADADVLEEGIRRIGRFLQAA
jgi:aminotransferase